MTVESWRIDCHKPTSADFYGVVEFEKGDSDYTVVGRLVPDSRLQDIADAWEAYKQAKNRGEDGGREFVTLAMRLDGALTEENNDE